MIPSTVQQEQEANERMMQPPPPVPQALAAELAPAANLEVIETNQQPPEQRKQKAANKDYSDGYGLFHISQLSDFILEVGVHAAWCSGIIELESTDFHYGAGITQKYRCSCNKRFVHKNCKWIKTDIVEYGRKYSRVQPELNIRIVKAAREVGVDLEKLSDLLAYMGIKTSAYRNVLHQERKIRIAIEDLSTERLQQNFCEHNVACRAQENYIGDIVWIDEYGVTHRVAQGPICFDGGGLTRAYGHKMKGGQAAFVVFSGLTGKPLLVVHYQVRAMTIKFVSNLHFIRYQIFLLRCFQIRCILCTRAYNKANEARKQKLYLDDVRVMEHEGKCYRNTHHGPANAEHYQAYDAARRLLLDDAGKYKPNTEMVFGSKVITDNDTYCEYSIFTC